MNKFEKRFFKKYIPEWQEIKWIIHEHWIVILKILFVWINMWALIPSFLYYNSIKIREVIPFYYLEWFLILVFIKIIYEIFNRYNDVWIITNSWVVDLDRALLNTDMKSVKYENIEWVWVEQIWIWDTILNKGDVVIHKIWDDKFILKDAIIPYDAVNEIERISCAETEETKEDKFDIVMDALAWVVENYLKDNKKDYSKEQDEDNINKIKNSDNTIDLRNN
jgi:hypothetical protein